METVLAEMLPLIIGAALVPAWVIILLLILRGDNGVPAALAFIGGATAVRLLQGVFFSRALDSSSGDGRIASLLLMLIGILLWITAIKKWRKEEDPDAPPPKWMTSLSQVSVLKAFGMGALLVLVSVKMWVFTLSAIALVQDPSLSQTDSIIAFLVYVVGSMSLLLVFALFAVLAPQQSKSTLGRISGWLEKHSQPILVVVSVIFGTYFLWKGLAGLLP